MLRVERVGKTYEPPGRALRLMVRTAHRDPVPALRDVDFTVRRGQVVGVVGPNGAGKSTLIRLCSSLLTPSTGRVLIDGQDLATAPPSVRARTGLVLADERALYWRLTGRQNLRFFGVMAGLTTEEADRRGEELLERFDLLERDRRVFGYSSGMRVRLSVARALLARPDLLILDEPSRSLDPVASDQLLALLRELAAGGCAVLLASHRLDEVEAVCDRVLVLINGEQRAWLHTEDLAGGPASVGATLRTLLRTEAET